MEVEGAEEADDAVVGTTAPPARQAGAWNRHDDAAVAGILAAARAAGATGASVRYGGVVTKVWFEPQGSDQEMVNEKFKRMQLATAQARIGELERRAVSDTNRAQKERERKKRRRPQEGRQLERRSTRGANGSRQRRRIRHSWMKRSSLRVRHGSMTSARRRPRLWWDPWWVAAQHPQMMQKGSRPPGWRQRHLRRSRRR